MNSQDLAFLMALKKGTKESIVQILSEEWPLTTKEIHARLKRGIKIISYQGTHKTLTEMEESKILVKKGKSYEINLSSIDKTIQSLVSIKQKYSKSVGRIKINKETEEPQVFHFNSYSEMCVTLADLLTSRVLAKKTELGFICSMEYGYFTFRFNFSDYLLLAKMMIKNPGSINIIRKKTPLGEWMIKQYKKINANCAPIGTPLNLDEDLFIQGDHIIEVRFSKETKEIFDKYYNKCHNMEDIFREFGLQNEPEVNITLTITKNPSLAALLKAKLKETYDNSVKQKPQ